MLAAQAPTSASAASFNNHVGVPISLARLPREARYGVFEIGMNHPGEIEPLARQVEAHVGVITNVGPVHIGYMGSEEAIADEKGCLFAGMAEGAVAVLNRDSPHYDRLAGHARRFGVSRIVGFGRSEAAEARLLSCSLQDTGSDVAALIHGRRIEYRLGAAGEHWVLNSIAALAVVEALGANVVEAAATLAGIGASPGRGARRMLKFGAGTVELLDESYNANPASMRAMLAVLARTEPAPGGRRLLALGDMRELGEGADAYHAGLADAVAASGAAQVFLCGPHMQALWHASGAGAARRASAGFGGARGRRRGGAAGRRRDRGEGLAGLENEECRRRHRGGKRRRGGTLKMLYNFSIPLADVFSPFNLFRYLTFRSGARLPDGAGAQLPDRRRR